MNKLKHLMLGIVFALVASFGVVAVETVSVPANAEATVNVEGCPQGAYRRSAVMNSFENRNDVGDWLLAAYVNYYYCLMPHDPEKVKAFSVSYCVTKRSAGGNPWFNGFNFDVEFANNNGYYFHPMTKDFHWEDGSGEVGENRCKVQDFVNTQWMNVTTNPFIEISGEYQIVLFNNPDFVLYASSGARQKPFRPNNDLPYQIFRPTVRPANAAAYAPPVASFTVDAATQTVGSTHTYDASASVCGLDPCRYQWRWYRTTGTDRLGTTMGEGPVLNYAFTGTGKKLVVLKVTQPNGTNNFSTDQKYVTVN